MDANAASNLRPPWEDPRVRAGTERLLADRRALLGRGERPLGWKIAFGPAAAHEPLGLSGPVVGFLNEATALWGGGECAVGEWVAPRLEPEVAIHLGRPVPAGAGPSEAAASVAGIGAAIELADVDRPPSELEEVVAADIYHRCVLLAPDPVFTALPEGPIAVAVTRDGEPLVATEDAEAATGRLAALVAYVARYLQAFELELQPGEVIISGSTVPLIEVAPGQAVRSEVAGAGAVDVRLT